MAVQPYSDRALEHTAATADYPYHHERAIIMRLLDAAHDRSVLGLEASAHIGGVIDAIVPLFDEWLHWYLAGQQDETLCDFLRRKFEAGEA